MQDFKEGKLDILLGTQILAKGHDFPKVTLLVMLEIDGLLNFPDFRAGERTFQFIVQASGRSGRGSQAGRVLLQTVREENKIVLLAKKHDYRSFIKKELLFRKMQSFPPFSRMTCIEILASSDKKIDFFK